MVGQFLLEVHFLEFGGNTAERILKSMLVLELSMDVTCLALHQNSDRAFPTSPFTIFEPQIPWINKICVVWERRVMDFKAPKL